MVGAPLAAPASSRPGVSFAPMGLGWVFSLADLGLAPQATCLRPYGARGVQAPDGPGYDVPPL